MTDEFAARMALFQVRGRDQAGPHRKLCMNDLHGLGEVGIVAHDYDAVRVASVGVMKKVRREIHVRSLLLGS
jgi:hypothetical protein